VLPSVTHAGIGHPTHVAGRRRSHHPRNRCRFPRSRIDHGSAHQQIQAAIKAAVHDQAARHADTSWSEILALYGVLERMTGNPMVTLILTVATAMVDGAGVGLAVLDGLDGQLGDHHRLHSVRAHLLELAGDTSNAIVEFKAAAARTANLREQHYLTTKAARLASRPTERPS
jgi:predicted RNA polymerase sigma factor